MDKLRPLLVLEVNEVPARVYDWVRGRYPELKHLNRFLSEATQGESVAVDGGELSPWMTWPTFHRGIAAKEHGIFHLGQDPKTFRGTPIWMEFRKRGHPIGICGSLQSWPPTDPGSTGFYLPDTFASDERTIPPDHQPLQAFNLSFVKENGRVRDGGFVKHVMNPALWMCLAELKPSTWMELVEQVVMEKLVRGRYDRRATFQSKIFFDLFRSLYSLDSPPAYSSFFTNHIAGLLHRYWSSLFPDDFDSEKREKGVSSLVEFHFAFRLLDRILGFAFHAQEKNPDLILIMASCIGQQAIQRADHEGFELLLTRPEKLLKAMDCIDAKVNLAMAPQVALEFSSTEGAKNFAKRLEELRWENGKSVFLSEVLGTSLSLTCKTPARKTIAEIRWKNQGTPITHWGLEEVKVEAGTAYHIAEGPLFVLAKKPIERSLRPGEKILATHVKERMMAWANL